MKKIFLIFSLFSVFNLAYSFQMSVGGGTAFTFTNYTFSKTGDANSQIRENEYYSDKAFSFNAFYDLYYVIFDISYKQGFLSDIQNLNFNSFGFSLNLSYPLTYREAIKLNFPFVGFKYVLDLNGHTNLFFFNLGFSGDLAIQDVNGLFLRPIFLLSFAPFNSIKGYNSSMITEITLAINLGFDF